MKIVCAFLFALLVPLAAYAAMLVGGETVYTVERGDSLELIGAKLGVNWWHLAKRNNLEINKPIHPGQKIRADVRKIVPDAGDPAILENGILINIPERMLYRFRDGKLKNYFPVGLGMAFKAGVTKWRTPIERFRVVSKEKDPVWHVPESIREEMEAEGKPVLEEVPPGPENPLGRRVIRLDIKNILIHETIWPASIYQFRSHGCIRVAAKDMEGFYGEVEAGTQGEIVYNPVKVAVSADGKVFLEVHPDVYAKVNNMEALAQELIGRAGASEKVDGEKVKSVLKGKTGIAEDVTK